MNDCIIILLCTFNGEKYLEEQLDSIVTQTHKKWIIHISDDGSTDKTLEIISRYIERYGAEKIKISSGPRKGFSKNFLFNLKAAPNGEYYAFCDQDDIWDQNKLRMSLEKAKKFPQGELFLYCGRTQLIDSVGNCVGQSPLFKKPAHLKNALVQSLAGGNTMLFNDAVKKILLEIPKEADVVAHDWLTYQVVAAANGHIFYDPNPFVKYRQHQNNLIGSNNGIFAKIKRIKLLFKGEFLIYNKRNCQVLLSLNKFFPEKNNKEIFDFSQISKKTIFERIKILIRLKLYRQTFLGYLGLLAAAFLNRI